MKPQIMIVSRENCPQTQITTFNKNYMKIKIKWDRVIITYSKHQTFIPNRTVHPVYWKSHKQTLVNTMMRFDQTILKLILKKDFSLINNKYCIKRTRRRAITSLQITSLLVKYTFLQLFRDQRHKLKVISLDQHWSIRILHRKQRNQNLQLLRNQYHLQFESILLEKNSHN